MIQKEKDTKPCDNNEESDEDLFAVFHESKKHDNGFDDLMVEATSGAEGHGDPACISVDNKSPARRILFDEDGAGDVADWPTKVGVTGSPHSSASFMSVLTGSAGASEGLGATVAKKTQQSLVREPNSGIRVSRPTRACEQLAVVLAQYPFATFGKLRQFMQEARGQSLPLVTVVGAVVRKTEPKRGSTGRGYGVIYIWDMKGPFVNSTGEVAILVGGSAFDVHYTKILSGLVLAVSGLQRMDDRGEGRNTPGSITSCPSSKGNDCGILKVTTMEQLRVLGFASDLGTCQGTQQRSGERCNNIVNKSLSNYCTYHVRDLRREARGTAPSVDRKPQPQPGGVRYLNAPGGTRMNLTALGSAQVETSKIPLQVLRRQKAGFLTVKGSSGLPASTPASADVMAAGNAYAGVVAGGPLPVNDVSLNAKRLLGHGASEDCSSGYVPAQIGVRTQGRTVLGAAAAAEEAGRLNQLLRLALHPNQMGNKRPRDGDEQPSWAEVRAKFAPLPTSRDLSVFAPLRGVRRGDVYATGGKNSRGDGSTPGSRSTHSVIVNVVERQLRAEGVLAKLGTQSAGSNQEGKTAQKITTNTPRGSGQPPVSPLEKVAESLHSINDKLRAVDQQQRLERQAERLLQQDKAMEALAAVTDQKLKAHYCRQCDRWYLRRNERCRSLGHFVEVRETVRRFIHCEHCKYKTSVVGDVLPSKRLPRCPRCSADAQWRWSNAAPESTQPVELCEGA